MLWSQVLATYMVCHYKNGAFNSTESPEFIDRSFRDKLIRHRHKI